jgi:hypothetical protein
MHHVVAYRTAAVAIGAVNESLSLIVGSSDNVANNRYFPPENGDIIWGFAFGTNLSNPRITTPTMLQVGPHSIWPYSAVNPQVPPFAFDDFNGYPCPIKAQETVNVQVSNLDAGAIEVFVVLGIRYRNDPKPTGPRRRVRFTAAITAAANLWTAGAITMDSDLPVGKYTIVGLSVLSATGVAARLTVPNEFYHPGVPMGLANGFRYAGNMDQYGWGGFGSFQQNVLPTLEVLCQAADTAQTGWLDLVKNV